jgi:hypothetical protein
MQHAQIGTQGLYPAMLLAYTLLIVLGCVVLGLLFGLAARLFACFGKRLQVLAILCAYPAFAGLGAYLGCWFALDCPRIPWYGPLIPLSGTALACWSVVIVCRKWLV